MLYFCTSTSAQCPGIVVLRIGGELDGDTRGTLVSGVMGTMWGASVTAVHLDLSLVEFIDCAGLGGLIELRNLATDRGCSFVLTRCSRSVTRLLRLTDMSSCFDLGPATPRDLPELRLAPSGLVD